MKTKISLLTTLAIFILAIATSSFKSPTPANEIQWLTFEQAIAKNKQNPKKFFIDTYTDWCGWCKHMDKTTFTNNEVIAYMNETYYAVKLDAEMKEDVTYGDQTFKFVANGNRGYHQLAASLLDNSMSYPSFVILDEKEGRLTIVPGYQKEDDLMCILHFFGKDNHLKVSFEDFKASWKK